LLQATETCTNKEPACAGGKHDPNPSLRFAERPPRYNTAGINRHDGPEDGNAALRCLTGGVMRFCLTSSSSARKRRPPAGTSNMPVSAPSTSRTGRTLRL
jgi:hypothetical protein